MSKTKYLWTRFSLANYRLQSSGFNFTWLTTNCSLHSGQLSTQAANQSRAKQFVDSYLHRFPLTYWSSKYSPKSPQHQLRTCQKCKLHLPTPNGPFLDGPTGSETLGVQPEICFNKPLYVILMPTKSLRAPIYLRRI